MKEAAFARRLFFGGGSIIALLLIIAIGAYRIFFSLLATNRLVAHTQEVRTEIAAMLSAVEEAETGQRGYLLTGDSLYLQPYYQAQQNMNSHIVRLSQLTVDNPEQQQRIPVLKLTIQKKLDELHDTLLLYNRRRYAEAQRVVRSNQGREQMETIRQILAQMRTTENRLLQQRAQAVSASAGRTLMALTVLAGLSFVFLLVTFQLTRRYMRERIQAEGILRASEERYRRLLETSYEGIWTLDAQGKTDFINPRGAHILGFEPEEMIGRSSSAHIFSEDIGLWQSLSQAHRQDIGSETELRMVCKDEKTIFVQASRSPIDSPTGTFQGVLCMFSDITDRKHAEQERIELLRRLVTAQEDERRRISRELHDEMGQYLTALMLGLDAVGNATPKEAPLHKQILQLQGFSKQVGQDVHRIAWELRPTALDDLGLEAALRNYLEEWSERVEVRGDFHSSPDFGRLLPEIETTLYRVVQEALTNIAKHANARNVSLLLERQGGHVNIIVEDDGVGMDTEKPAPTNSTRRAMGLIGIKERIALIGGEFTLESTPGQGTTLFLHVPLSSSAARIENVEPLADLSGVSHEQTYGKETPHHV